MTKQNLKQKLRQVRLSKKRHAKKLKRKGKV